MDGIAQYDATKQRAFELCDRGNMIDGARELESLVSLARELNDPYLLIEALTEFGGLIKYLDRFSESEKALLEVCRLLESYFPGHTAQRANALVNLGNLYRMMGNLSGAEQHLCSAMKLEEAAELTGTEDYAGLCNNLALLYQQIGRHDQALELHQRNLRYLEQAGSPEYLKGTSFNNMAALYLEMGNPDAAEDAVRKSLACYDGEVYKESSLYLTALNTLSAVYCRKGMLKEARELLVEQVEPLCASVYGTNSINYRGVRSGLAALTKQLDEEEGT